MDPLERIRELIGRIGDLTTKEQDELDGLIAKVFAKVDAAPSSVETIAQMTELVEAKRTAKAERDARAAKEAEAAQAAQALRDEMQQLSGVDAEGNPVEPVATDEPETPEVPEEEGEEVAAIAAAAYEPEPYAPKPDETVGCPSCQKLNEPDASYCDQCGEKLAGNADVVPPAAQQTGSGDGGGADNTGGDGGAATAPAAAATAPVVASVAPRKVTPPAMAAVRPRPTASPERPQERRGIAMTATSGLSNYNPGDSLGMWGDPDTRMTVARAVTDKVHRVGKNGPGEHVVARADWGDLYPEERRFTEDEARNALVPMTASGGVALPVDADFSIMGFLATAETPLLNALPSYNASRGGLRYVQPIDISAVQAGVATWTEATDASPGANTKPVYQVSVQPEQLVYVDAVVTRLEFGNFSRFYPEQVALNIDAAQALSARDVELHLLANMITGSTLVTSAKTFGTTRDLLPTLDLLVANARTQRRWPRSVGLNLVMNDWVKDMVRADLARQLATAQASGYEPLAITDAQIEEFFTIRGVKPIWVLDGVPGATQSAVTYVAQSFAGQTAGASLNDWPTEVCAILYPDQQWQLLDGGTLDLGILRDSLLSATNDYQIFTERFVNVAQRGVSGGSQFLVATTHPYGSSSATVAANSNH
jgi:hypothetical protein